MKNNFKEYFQDNLLDGDDVRACGKVMLSAEHTYEVLNECVYDLLKQQKEELLKELKLDSRYKTDSSWFKNSFDDCIALGHEDGWNEAVDDLNNKIDNLKDKSYFQDNKRLEDIS